MNFLLSFDNSGDTLPFKVIYNQPLFEFFVDKINQNQRNQFTPNKEFATAVNSKIAYLNWSLSKVNEVLHELTGNTFTQQSDLENYLDQSFLNKLHADWVLSQDKTVNIDKLRFSKNHAQAKIGSKLHELYPDDIRNIRLAESMEKLGYIFPYEEVNMSVHKLESSFDQLEFKAENKWDVIANPFTDSMTTNNDKVNFSFGYTYLGRQYYNKFKYFDTKLEFPDHYNYETLEFAFQLNLSRPETVPFSCEATTWAKQHNIKLVAEQIPIANLVDLENKLFDYRKIIYRNTKNNNSVKIVIR